MATADLKFTVDVDTEGIMERIYSLLTACLTEIEEKAQFWITSGDEPERAYRNAIAAALAAVEISREKLSTE